MKEMDLGPVDQVPDQGVHTVALGFDAQGRPMTGLIMRIEGGGLRAYLDRCRHLPIPLAPAGNYTTGDDEYLVCSTHGARFRTLDGQCVEGPCLGKPLHALRLREHDGHLFIALPSASGFG